MSEAAADHYRQHWQPDDYLREYYADKAGSSDELANLRFLRKAIDRIGRPIQSVLEVGCGPTVHHLLPLIDRVQSVHLADLLPENLELIQRWLAGDTLTFDWDASLELLVAGLNWSHSHSASQLRSWLNRIPVTFEQFDVLHQTDTDRNGRPVTWRDADVASDRGPSPQSEAQFDLVLSYYCLECATSCVTEWAHAVRNLTRRLAPGGTLVLGALLNCDAYHIGTRTFPSLRLNGSEFLRVLPDLGFIADSIEIETARGDEFRDQGFEATACVSAVKAGAT